MCVIMTAEKERPSRAELRAAATTNPHGAGLAWVEGGRVRFEKVGPDPKDIDRIIGLALKVPLPFVVHFRITSSGVTAAALSHPFPVRVKDATATSGTAGSVLFHNGTWRGWERFVAETAKRMKSDLDLTVPFSDSRAMAYLAAVLGRAVLDLVPQTQRVAVLTPASVTRQGDGWSEFAPGLWVSNRNWTSALHVAEEAPKVKSAPKPKSEGALPRDVELAGPRLVKAAKQGIVRWVG